MEKDLDNLVLNEIQLVLSMKRTSLSLPQNGIFVFTLPFSVLSFLIPALKYFHTADVLRFILLLVLLYLELIFSAHDLLLKSIHRIRHNDNPIVQRKQKSKILSLIDK